MTMKVTIPEGRSGDVEIRRIVTGPPSLRDLIRNERVVPQGTYTVLYRDGRQWMSDTPAEQMDHLPALHQAHHLRAKRCLVNGLGIGMVVGALLRIEHVEHIDVVEIDPDVIALVADHYQKMATDLGKTVTVHQGDAYTIRWPTHTRWDIVWSDIWPTACIDNLSEMTTLRRRYARRCSWHGCWLRELLLSERRRDGRESRLRLKMYGH